MNLSRKDLKSNNEGIFPQTEQGFNDLSLNSHDEILEFQHAGNFRSKTLESFTPNPRSTSISLHKSDLESAFIQQFQFLAISPSK